MGLTYSIIFNTFQLSLHNTKAIPYFVLLHLAYQTPDMHGEPKLQDVDTTGRHAKVSHGTYTDKKMIQYFSLASLHVYLVSHPAYLYGDKSYQRHANS